MSGVENNRAFARPLLPEILSRIMEFLSDDRAALRSALLVNKLWAAEAMTVLWQKPPVEALASSPDDHRQFYARQVRELDFGGDKDGKHHSTFRSLEFPRLRRITIDFYRPDDGEKLWLDQYIQPNLEEFIFYGAEPAGDLLNLLETRCPRLRCVLIGYVWEGVSASRLIKFFDCCKSLRSICLPSNMERFLDDQMFAYFARRHDLEELEFGKTITYEMVEKALDGIQSPFKYIQRLTVPAESKALKLLAPTIKSVTTLELNVEDSQFNPLPLVSSLVNLRELEIAPQWASWSATDFLALKGLKNLRRLEIYPIEDDLTSPNLTDPDFVQIFANMSELQQISFQVQCTLSTAAITSLGQHCRQLTSCDLLGSYYLNSWLNIERPLFPHLRQLELGAIIPEEQGPQPPSSTTRAQKLAHLIVEHAPNLEQLQLWDRDEFSKEVVAAFKAETGNEYNP
ncbi:uncharacterized protein BDW43DRAFT_135697 [Aspergillus alliaceus]|uniref:uncharacterized protein n=1 Tax=Petromyces alliaceus TaxID=209559 RepID=UPI0012A62F36|nr:uncharacterized protein BDW43DRAFT_135697 [Aspergillus alliaceus]KAB8231636.1 hypothetical protein BDW43DRAFT_135697 [Aspergillus alliaceus]